MVSWGQKEDVGSEWSGTRIGEVTMTWYILVRSRDRRRRERLGNAKTNMMSAKERMIDDSRAAAAAKRKGGGGGMVCTKCLLLNRP